MGNLDLPADVIGHMAALGGTDKPLEMCPSCQRALIYGSLLYSGACGSSLSEARRALEAGDILAAGALMADVEIHLQNSIRTQLEIAKEDFAGACNLVEHMTDDEYVIAMESFFRQRTEHYTNPDTGEIVFESHGRPDTGLDELPV